MKFSVVKSLLLVALGFICSCQKDSSLSENDESKEGVEFNVTFGAQSRVANNSFESGDIVMFDAYTEDGEQYANNVSYTYLNGILSSSNPIVYPSSGEAISFVACYPTTSDLAKTFTHTASTDQSSVSSYESNDLLIATIEASREEQPTAQFKHVMSCVVVTITNSEELSDVTIYAKNSLYCDTENMSFTASGDTAEIMPQDLGNNQYMVVVAPQEMAKGDTFITATIDGSEYTWSTTSSVVLESGYKYNVSCTLGEEDIVVIPTDTYNAYWAELPSEPVDDGNYYYAHHTVTLNSKTVRNFSACYSNDYTCPVWVAGPYHTCYSQGTGSRSDNYQSDPQISCYQVETLGSPYNRGHMIASSDRLGNQEMNNQAFYLSNIAPQLLSYFNSGGGIWNNYEDAIQDWYESRTDTLYLVNGCNWENTNTVVDGTTVPTHYYKALLRCKTANSTKSVFECSASELECAAFYFEHKSSQDDPKASHMISIEELEAKTGFTYFSNVPNAPKSTYSASDWGL